MKRTTLFIDPALERELQALARRNRQPMAALVREAVAQYVAAARAGEPSRRLGFIGAGRSGRDDVAEQHEALLFQPPAAAAPPSPPPPRRARRPVGRRQARR